MKNIFIATGHSGQTALLRVDGFWYCGHLVSGSFESLVDALLAYRSGGFEFYPFCDIMPWMGLTLDDLYRDDPERTIEMLHLCIAKTLESRERIGVIDQITNAIRKVIGQLTDESPQVLRDLLQDVLSKYSQPPA